MCNVRVHETSRFRIPFCSVWRRCALLASRLGGSRIACGDTETLMLGNRERGVSRVVQIVFSIALLLHVSLPEQGFTMRVELLTLEQMVEKAVIVFVGQCLSSTMHEDPHIGRIVTVTEFDVVEVLKGDLGARHTIKHYGGAREHGAHRITGMPTYMLGEEVILFLYGENRYGLTSPVGMSQGKFTLVHDTEPSSHPMVVNSINNNGLLTGFDRHLSNTRRIDEHKRTAIQSLVRVNRGPIPYDDFVLITKMVMNRNTNVAD